MWSPVPGLGVSAAAGRAAGVVDCRFAGVQNFQSKAAFSGAMAVAMAMQGGLIRKFRSKTERDTGPFADKRLAGG